MSSVAGLLSGAGVGAACYLIFDALVTHSVAVALAAMIFAVTTIAIGWALR